MFTFFSKKKRSQLPKTVVFDVGGTKMRVAEVVDGAPTAVCIEKTPKDPREGINTLISMIQNASGGVPKSISGCIAGWVGADGKLEGARNLPTWNGMAIASQVQTAFGSPVYVANDAEFAGLGEASVGAGVGFSSIAYITVSTGVGGALIVRGAIDSSARNLEVGRIMVDGSDLESLVSGTAVKKRFGVEPKEFDSVAELVALARTLAQGLVAVAEKWKPEAIVLGGSMIVGANAIPLDEVTKHFNELMQDAVLLPKIKKATLGDVGGLYGAAVYAKQKGEI